MQPRYILLVYFAAVVLSVQAARTSNYFSWDSDSIAEVQVAHRHFTRLAAETWGRLEYLRSKAEKSLRRSPPPLIFTDDSDDFFMRPKTNLPNRQIRRERSQRIPSWEIHDSIPDIYGSGSDRDSDYGVFRPRDEYDDYLPSFYRKKRFRG